MKIPVISKPENDLIDSLQSMTDQEVINSVLEAKEARLSNGVTTSEVCLRSRLHQAQVSKLELVAEIPSAKLAARYIQSVQDSIKEAQHG